jgi:biotin synthase
MTQTLTETHAAPTSAAPRFDWRPDEIAALFELPFNDLLFRAQTVHREHFDPNAVQVSTLLSIKTGGCPEDCGYCPQSVHHEARVQAEKLMDVESVVQAARNAKQAGASRFCMGAAWRNPRGRNFERVLEMVERVRAEGLETCVTLGMLDAGQSRQLKAAGLDYYNHNLDTSPEFYDRIITTRRYEERLRTLEHVRQAGITVCCGGIIGMGESDDDRIGLLHQLARLDPHPESVPINMLVAVEGTPLAEARPADPLALVRCIATARVLMPASMVRLSAGRRSLTREAAALCFLAGANSIFTGEKLLTTPNPEVDEDQQLFRDLGLRPMAL